MTLFAHPTEVGETTLGEPAAPAKLPSRWSLRNWPVRRKVLAIALVPLLLALAFGGFRIYNAVTDARDLRLAADRAELVPAVESYLSALETALVASTAGGDAQSAVAQFDTRRSELQQRLDNTDVVSDVRLAVNTLLSYGKGLLDEVTSDTIPLRQRVTRYVPLLLTAETAITGSVRVDDENIRLQAEALARAVDARGQMAMQQMLVDRGGELPEPELRASMTTLAGTEPSTISGMSKLLGGASPEAATLRSQLVLRMSILSDPASVLAGNPELLQSIQTTDDIAGRVITDTTASVTQAVSDQATDRRNAAIRDIALVLGAIVVALLIVVLVARSLIRPLRTLRDSALKVAHEDLEHEIAQVRAGDERAPEPLPVYTTEEVGQVAHAVDELHTQALLLAGDEARLRLLVNDMFETMSRRNRSLVDQQLSLIDRLEKNEDDPDRLDSLFRLDHLATRMRRNGANLLVLAGAQASREHGDPVPLANIINAAASEVEDYRRVETGRMPDCSVVGPVVGDAVHMLAELIDNALRYSPPVSPVRVSAVHTGNAGLLVEVSDAGLGMTEADLRIANMRLSAGGEVSPDNARHMGLFVVGRLAHQHGMVVRLRNSVAAEERSGTTVEVYLPPELLVRAPAPGQPEPQQYTASPQSPLESPGVFDGAADAVAALAESHRNGSAPGDSPITLLPRRSPGSSGITEAPAGQDQQPPQPASPPLTDMSAYFSSRPQVDLTDMDELAAELATPHQDVADDDVIYQRMLSEWLVDPHTLAEGFQDWKSVWDSGWSAAAEVDRVPVESHTDHGLPVREPGARLVPGAATDSERPGTARSRNGAAHGKADDENGVASNGQKPGRHEAPERDPEAIRSSISSHFGGVRAGRSHARETSQGSDHE